jgi:hypothetical protein
MIPIEFEFTDTWLQVRNLSNGLMAEGLISCEPNLVRRCRC